MKPRNRYTVWVEVLVSYLGRFGQSVICLLNVVLSTAYQGIPIDRGGGAVQWPLGLGGVRS
jgi:hypothetical protein